MHLEKKVFIGHSSERKLELTCTSLQVPLGLPALLVSDFLSGPFFTVREGEVIKFFLS